MTTMTDQVRAWYRRLEARKLAKLSPSQRAEILAFDESVRRHKWRYKFAFLAVLLVAATAFRYGVNNATWLEAVSISFLLIVATGFAMLSAWFGYTKYTVSVKTVLFVFGLAVAGALLGGLIGRYVKVGSLQGVVDDFGSFGGRVLVAGLIAGAVYAGLLLAVMLVRRRVLQSRNEELKRQAEQERIARQLADARLRLMQAQVEPHFLFNTLASVQQLAEAKGRAPEAAALTGELITFLRAGLAGLRDDTTTLAREFEMAAAFLAIMKTRMGDRLSFHLNLPEGLADRAVPPAMLISLVENAIKHGLEPSKAGGELHISARHQDSRLYVEVRDTGLGLGIGQTGPGGGVGLTNVRERLQAIYGDGAALSIEENQPNGVVAMISIDDAKPFETVEPASDCGAG
jgi:sensor histidine kinase YesM